MTGLRMIILLLFAAQAQAQSRPECTCNNLESLQQEYQNAVYLEKEFRNLSKALKEWEAAAFKRAAAEGLNVAATSRRMVEKARREFMYPPFPQVAGSTAPMAVELIPGFCHPKAADVKAVETGAPCLSLGEAEILNAVTQQLICEKMGADKYWKRMGSEVALEKADNYKDKVGHLKDAIGQVLKTADVRLKGEWRYTLAGEGIEATHYATFDSGDMKLSTTGDGGWKLTGKGDSVDTIVAWKMPDNCFITGKMTGDLSVSLGTDGLRFGVEMAESNFHEDYQVHCPEATSTPDDSGESFGFSGTLGTDIPLKAGDNAVPSPWADYYKANALTFWSSVTGEPSTTVSVTCEKP